MYTLEKLDSSLILNHEGRGAPKVRQPSASRAYNHSNFLLLKLNPIISPALPNTPSPAATTSKIDEDELFRELESTLAEDNADEDKDEDIPLSASSPLVASNIRKVEPIRPPPPVVSGGKPRPGLKGSPAARATVGPTVKTKPIKSSPLVPLPKPPSTAPSASQPVPPATTAQRVRSPEKGKSALAPAIDVEEEVLEFGQPTRPAKRAKISPPRLALPASKPSNSAGLSSPGGFATLPGPPAGHDDEDDEDEWDEVAGGDHTVNANPGGGDDGSIFGGEPDEGEEINLDEFAAEMDQELLGGLEEEDGDGDADGEMEDIFGEVEPAPVLKPMSLNQFAGGGTVGVDDVDDDYSSSSDESDDD